MRWLLTRVVVVLSFALGAAPLRAQSMEQLPAGVRLRVTTPNATVSGTLAAQSSDSVWIDLKGTPHAVQGVATAHIQHVERAEPNFPPSMLLGAAAGAAVGALVYFSNAQRDRGMVFGTGVGLGAVAGMLFPRMRWLPVPLK